MRSAKHIGLLAVFLLPMALALSCDKPAARMRFNTPDEAATAVLAAFKTQDQQKMEAVFGHDGMEAAASGDPVADRLDRQVVAMAMEQSWHWGPHGDNGKELIIGDEQWPFPVPLVKNGEQWEFDTEAGKVEVLARRIGRNEFGVIDLCRSYVAAQKEYAAQPHDGKPSGLLAQHLRSAPGRHDGLYWERKAGDKRSPLGDLVASAAAEGYDPTTPAAPFQGYHFKILTAQGPAAPGGKKSYVVNGDMSGGFALVAYPEKYASSGVMTFVVGADGSVYQKDLGEQTTALVAALTEYNPDESWTLVQAQ